MPEPFKKLSLKLGQGLIKQIAENVQEKQQQQQVALEQQREFERQKYFKKINYINFISIKYFQHTPQIKKFLLSTLLLDLLIFNLPDNALNFLHPVFFISLKQNCEYILLILATLIIYFKIYGLRSIKLPFGGFRVLTGLICAIVLFSLYQIFNLSSSSDWLKLLVQVGVIAAGLYPLVKGLKELRERPDRPQVYNLLSFVFFLIPLLVLRFINFAYVLAIYGSQSSIIHLIAFITCTAMLMLKINPLSWKRNVLL